MNKKYELIIFDWDGTLMDSTQHIVECLQYAAKAMQLPIKDARQCKEVIGLGLHEALSALYPQLDSREAIQTMADHYRECFLDPYRPASKLFEGVKNMLQALQDQGYDLAVATGKSRRGLDHVLAQSQLKDYFLITRCADETFSKPHPLMLEEIFTELGTKKALMVGDSEYDILLAHNAGIDALGVAHGVHDTERLLEKGALTCLHAVTEIVHWLNDNNSQ